MRRFVSILIIAFLPVLLGAGPVTPEEQEWTRFRGPNGTGLSLAKNIPTKWTEKNYNWRVELPGIGHSSPVIWNNKLFLTSAVEDSAERVVLCLDAETGSAVWERRFPSSVHHKHLKNSFASSTPALDKEHVYVTWSAPDEYSVMALDHNGKDVWKVNLGPVVSQHSTGTSPIVFDGMVILGNDQDGPGKDTPDANGDSFLVALDCTDGRERWRTKRGSAVVSYSTPCVYYNRAKKPELIFNSQAHGISSIDPQTGKLNWELGVLDKRSVSSPIVAAGLIFGTTGSGGGGSYVAAVKPGPKPTLAYKLTEKTPYVPTLVAKDKLLFLWSDKGIVSCIDAPTGNTYWIERVGGNYSGSPVIIGQHVYCIAEDGTVVVLAASPKFNLVAQIPLGEGSHSTPAVAGGHLYLRTYSHLISLGGK